MTCWYIFWSPTVPVCAYENYKMPSGGPRVALGHWVIMPPKYMRIPRPTCTLNTHSCNIFEELSEVSLISGVYRWDEHSRPGVHHQLHVHQHSTVSDHTDGQHHQAGEAHHRYMTSLVDIRTLLAYHIDMVVKQYVKLWNCFLCRGIWKSFRMLYLVVELKSACLFDSWWMNVYRESTTYGIYLDGVS